MDALAIVLLIALANRLIAPAIQLVIVREGIGVLRIVHVTLHVIVLEDIVIVIQHVVVLQLVIVLPQVDLILVRQINVNVQVLVVIVLVGVLVINMWQVLVVVLLNFVREILALEQEVIL